VTDRLGAVLTAISDPTRRAIINRLARGPARVTDVAAPFPVSLNTVSKHFKALERVRLIRRTRRGREHMLTLNAEPLRAGIRWVWRYERFWNERLDRLEALFDAGKEERW
jgi:DNA-binding transcriptional ArsR family regulator